FTPRKLTSVGVVESVVLLCAYNRCLIACGFSACINHSRLGRWIKRHGKHKWDKYFKMCKRHVSYHSVMKMNLIKLIKQKLSLKKRLTEQKMQLSSSKRMEPKLIQASALISRSLPTGSTAQPHSFVPWGCMSYKMREGYQYNFNVSFMDRQNKTQHKFC
ncbi:hypothetical protein L9F63_020819, partial [Diploptera punctata]